MCKAANCSRKPGPEHRQPNWPRRLAGVGAAVVGAIGLRNNNNDGPRHLPAQSRLTSANSPPRLSDCRYNSYSLTLTRLTPSLAYTPHPSQPWSSCPMCPPASTSPSPPSSSSSPNHSSATSSSPPSATCWPSSPSATRGTSSTSSTATMNSTPSSCCSSSATTCGGGAAALPRTSTASSGSGCWPRICRGRGRACPTSWPGAPG